MLNLITRQSN